MTMLYFIPSLIFLLLCWRADGSVREREDRTEDLKKDFADPDYHHNRPWVLEKDIKASEAHLKVCLKARSFWAIAVVVW